MTNKQTEDAAIEVVLAFERDHGRNARDVRQESGADGYDVQSTGRKIEVKGIGGQFAPPRLWRYVQVRTVALFMKDRQAWMYIVDNLRAGKHKAGIYVLDRDAALRRLSPEPQVVYTLSVPKEDRERLRQAWCYRGGGNAGPRRRKRAD